MCLTSGPASVHLSRWLRELCLTAFTFLTRCGLSNGATLQDHRINHRLCQNHRKHPQKKCPLCLATCVLYVKESDTSAPTRAGVDVAVFFSMLLEPSYPVAPSLNGQHSDTVGWGRRECGARKRKSD